MRTRRNPYIDHDGVRRVWYVYLHPDKSTNQVLYVGMGTGNRAWDTTRRAAFDEDRALANHEVFQVDDVVSTIESAMNGIESAIEDYRTRIISWKDFCDFPYQDIRIPLADLEEEEFEHDNAVERLISYTKEVLSLYSGFLKRVSK